MTNKIEETLKGLLEMGKNDVNCPHCAKYNEIAMESPENMEIAIKLVKDQFWRAQADKTYERKYPVSCYTAPWVADKNARYIGKIRVPATILTSWSDGDDAFNMYVFDVHGVMKACTHISEAMMPTTVGCAYDKMPDRNIWV